MLRVGVYTAICEEDAQWVDQYLAEIERLDTPFALHFDRCSPVFKYRLASHPLCIGTTAQDDPAIEFSEMHKQGVLDVLVREGFEWALAWDIDETYERDAVHTMRAMLESLPAEINHVDVRWLTLWNDVHHVRVDDHYAAGHRVKFLRLGGDRRWEFYHPTVNGPKLVAGEVPRCAQRYDFVSLHHGMMTKELRLLYKDRWDRIYTDAVGKNPYGFWDKALEEKTVPVLIRHAY